LQQWREIILRRELPPIFSVPQHAPRINEALLIHRIGIEALIICALFSDPTQSHIGHGMGRRFIGGDGSGRKYCALRGSLMSHDKSALIAFTGSFIICLSPLS
jgi:hypothetical protein